MTTLQTTVQQTIGIDISTIKKLMIPVIIIGIITSAMIIVSSSTVETKIPSPTEKGLRIRKVNSGHKLWKFERITS